MQKVSEIALEKAQGGIFSRQEAACWMNRQGASLDSLLKRAVAAEEILRVRRGLFCLAGRYRRRSIHPFELAQRVFGPSYVSLESALAHHGWIPEAVYAITCVSQDRSRSFDSPMGLFCYTRVPQERFYAGVRREQLEGGGICFVAEPLKALADYVYVHACDWVGIAPVMGSLRIESDDLHTVTELSFEAVMGAYRSGRVCRFLDSLRKEMKL